MDLIKDLDTPIEELLKIHTGHAPSDSSESGDSDSYRINDVGSHFYRTDKSHINLQNSYAQGHETGYFETLYEHNSEETLMKPLEISRKLAQSLTTNYCFICNRSSSGDESDHYTTTTHYKRVLRWIKKLLGFSYWAEVNIRNIFCLVCNFPFVDEHLIADHHHSECHKINARSFCWSCLQNVPEADMASHKSTKRHIKNEKKYNFIALNETDGSKIDGMDCRGVSAEPDYNFIALELKKKLSTDFCFLCIRNVSNNDHYKTKKHLKNVRYWIKQKCEEAGLAKISIDSIFCDACNDVFCDLAMAKGHYNSIMHNVNSANYCKVCQKHVKSIEKHISSSNHLSKEKFQSVLGNVFQPHEIGLAPSSSENMSLADSISLASEESIDTTASIENITEELKKSVTPNYCYICKKNKGKSRAHFKAPVHRIQVLSWINNKLGKLKEFVSARDIYCEECNLPLIDISLRQNHYNSDSHIKKADSYCFVCKKNSSDIRKHLDSEKHHNRVHSENIESVLQSNGTIDGKNIESVTQNKATIGCETAKSVKQDIVKDGSERHINADKTNLVVSEGMNYTRVSGELDYNFIALELQKKLKADFCYLCIRNVLNNDHYKSKKHIKNVTKWIKENFEESDFGEINIDSIFCEACNEVFFDLAMANRHYNSGIHKGNSANYCKICQKHVKSMERHLSASTHSKRKKLPSVWINVFQPHEIGMAPSSSKNMSLTNSINLASNGSDFDVSEIKYASIAEKLENLITPIFCAICAKVVNMLLFDHHYLQKEHILSVRTWLDEQLRLSEVNIDKKLLYCEACCLNLCGTKKALDHYQKATHIYNEKTYCPTCIFRGSPNALVEHNLNKHQNTLKNSDCSNKEHMPSDSWRKNLAKLITISECKLCSLKLPNAEEANCHYQSANHSTTLQIWINKFGNFSENKSPKPEKAEAEVFSPNVTKMRQEIDEDTSVKPRIMQELKKLLERVYFSKKMPLETALVHLKKLNGDIANFSLKQEGRSQIDNSITANIENTSSFVAVHNELRTPVKNAAKEYEKLKLSMEISRLKLVLENYNRIPREIAFQYIHNLNQLVDDLINKPTVFYDVSSAFELGSKFIKFLKVDPERILQSEIERLEVKLFNDTKLRVDVALDCIMQFNIHLESMLQYQTNDDIYDE